MWHDFIELWCRLDASTSSPIFLSGSLCKSKADDVPMHFRPCSLVEEISGLGGSSGVVMGSKFDTFLKWYIL